MADTLEIFLLGTPRLRYRGGAFAFRGGSGALALLVYLLLHRRHPVSRDGLAFVFWPDAPANQGRARIRTYLHALVRSLPSAQGASWILAGRNSLQWNPRAPFWIDAEEFHRRSIGSDDEAVEAVGLYAGDLAEGLAGEWLFPLRDDLRDEFAGLLWRVIASFQSVNDAAQASRYTQQLLRFDPLREDAVRALMELNYERGDRAGALQTYHAFAERLMTELGVTPMPETTSMYEHIERAQSESEAALREGVAISALHIRPPHNLPASLTTFLGREREVQALSDLLNERRLITVTGMGGVGKTRLAVHTAHRLIGRFRDGVRFIELADLTEPRLVAEKTATSLGMEDRSQHPSFAALHLRQPLLIFDNCEHVLDAVAGTVNRLLAECPQIRIIATSREPLRVRGERVFHLDPLSFPTRGTNEAVPLEEIRSSPAVRLFLERAAELAPNFREPESEEDWNALLMVARRLNGIPLAIELAAARTNVLSVAWIARSLDDRFGLLTHGARTDLSRHQTMEACLDWSFALLSPDERRHLCSLAVFANGFTLEAAAFVCEDSEAETVALLQALVDKSLVLADVGAVETRYSLLETIRAHAFRKLTASGGDGAALRNQARYFAAYAEHVNSCYSRTISKGSPPSEERVDVVTLLRLLTRELDNIRAAMDWTLTAGHDRALGARIVAALWRFFIGRSLYAEGERWADAALLDLAPDVAPRHEGQLHLLRALNLSYPYFMPVFERKGGAAVEAARRAAALLPWEDDGQLHGIATGILVMSLRLSGRIAEAWSEASDALAEARASGDPIHIGIILHFQAFAAEADDVARPIAGLEQACKAYEQAGFEYGIAYTMLSLAEASFSAGKVSAALEFVHRAQDYYRRIEDWSTLMIVRANIAKYLNASGDVAAARGAAADALRLAEETGDAALIALALQPVAAIAVRSGDPALAASLLAAADRLFEKTGRRRVLFAAADYAAVQDAIGDELTEAGRRRAVDEGRSWALPRAIAQAAAMFGASTSRHSE